MKKDYDLPQTTWSKKGSTYFIKKTKGNRYYEVWDSYSYNHFYKRFLSFSNADKFLQKTIQYDHDLAVRRNESFKKKMSFIRRDREA